MSYEEEMERLRAKRDFAKQENERREKECEMERKAKEMARLKAEQREMEIRKEYEYIRDRLSPPHI